MSTASGTDNLTEALRRRFRTPYGSLFYDRTYGNKLHDRLSAPMGRTFEQDAIADATECLMADPRVQSVRVRLSLNHEERRVRFTISYVAKNGSAAAFEEEVALRV
ncbi:GPW/gp25 family protein [Paenibacillus elgii]